MSLRLKMHPAVRSLANTTAYLLLSSLEQQTVLIYNCSAHHSGYLPSLATAALVADPPPTITPAVHASAAEDIRRRRKPALVEFSGLSLSLLRG